MVNMNKYTNKGGGGNNRDKKRKSFSKNNDSFFDSASKRQKKPKGKGEEIHSSDEEDDFIDREIPSDDEEEEPTLEDTETADEKRLRVAKAYLDKIRAITKAHQDDDEEEDEDETERKGKRDSLVAEILQQEQLEESGRVQRLLASRVVKPLKPSEFRVVKRHKQSVTTVALTEDDVRGFSASKDGAVFHWDVETGVSEQYDWPSKESLTKSKNGKKDSKHVLALAVSSDGRYLATGGLDRYVHLWDTRTRQHIQAFPGHRGAVSCLAFRQGTQQLISGSFDRTIKLWSAEDRSYMDTLYGHQSEILMVDCLRKERVLSVGRDRTLRLWKVPEETQLVFRAHAASLESCCFVSNDEFISGSDDGSVELWNMMRKKPVFIAKGAHGKTKLGNLSEDPGNGETPEEMTSTKLSNGSDIGHGNIVHQIGNGSSVESWVGAVTVCRGSDLAVSGAGDGLVRLWAIESTTKSLRFMHDIPLTGFVNSLAFASSGRFLVAGVGKVTQPWVKVLHLVDSDLLLMGYLYEAMDRANGAVQRMYARNRNKLDPLESIINRRWTHQLHRPLHAAGYYFNPKFFYDDNFEADDEVMDGLYTCMDRMIPDDNLKALCPDEIQAYKKANGRVLSSVICKMSRKTLRPDLWWEDNGARCPNLQRMAVRILSQPCSASGCECNWSMFESIHTKRCNRLSQQRLNDLVFVQYNLRLHVRQVEGTDCYDAIDLDSMDPLVEWVAEDEEPIFTDEDIERLEREAAGEAEGTSRAHGEGTSSAAAAAFYMEDEDEYIPEPEYPIRDEDVPVPLPSPPHVVRSEPMTYKRARGKRPLH